VPGLARLGTPTQRLRSAAASARRACRDYARAAATYQRVAPLLSSYEAVDKVGDLLQQAVEHEGNGSNGLRQAESTAKLALYWATSARLVVRGMWRQTHGWP
jgi:hypothetical protein